MVFFISFLKVYLQITYLLIKSTLSRYDFHVIQCILLSVPSWQVHTCVTTGTIKIWNISIKSKSPLHGVSLPPPAPGNHKSAFCHDRLVLLDFHAIGIMRFVLFRLWPHSLRIFWYPSILCAWAVCNILLITGIHWVVDHSLFTRDGRFLRCSHSFFFFCLF